jgi:hypothetical protein
MLAVSATCIAANWCYLGPARVVDLLVCCVYHNKGLTDA